jgi:hypothetical protein
MKKLFLFTFLTVLSVAVFAQIEEKPAKKQKTKKNEIIAEDTLPKVPVIKFNNLVHDYGTIYKNDNGVCTFTFTNVGKADLQLTNVTSTCGCTVPEWPKEPVPPKQSATIKVSYNTANVGTINKSIFVDSNTEERITLQIKGAVIDHPKELIPENEPSNILKNDK